MSGFAINHRWAQWMADTVLVKFPELKNSWSYDYGVVFKGLEKVYELTENKKYFEYIKNNMDHFVCDNGEIKYYDYSKFNLDYINNGKILLYLYKKTKEEKYANAARVLRKQLEEQPRTSDGGFWHKKIYPHQMWLDGLYMAEPFYAEYISMFEEDKSFDDVLLQFRLIEEHSKDKAAHLLFHGYDNSKQMFWADKQTGLSSCFWGRSVGWYACALVDTSDHINNDAVKTEIINMIKDLAEGIVNVQSEQNHVWYQVLDKEGSFGNYPEASCSCMFVYFLLKAVRKGYINTNYLEYAKRGFYGIIREFIEIDQNKLLNLKNTVFVSGLGMNCFRDGSYEYYISEPKQMNNLLGIGAFMMAAAEFEKTAQY